MANIPLNPYPKALQPAYKMSQPNEAIPLYSGSIHLTFNGQTYNATGSISLSWLPTPDIRCELQFQGGVAAVLMLREFTLAVNNWNQNVDGYPIHISSKGGTTTELIGNIGSNISIGDPNYLQYALFHLPNFHKYHGHAITDDGMNARTGRLEFESADWKITLDTIESADFSALESARGYLLTHVGKLEKKDQSTFVYSEAVSVLESLHVFFTLCRGLSVAPMLVVGFDSSGSKKWETWTLRACEPFKRVDNWFPQMTNNIALPFNSFMTAFKNPLWRDTLDWSIYLYTQSSGDPVNPQTGIILTQSALEMIAWTLIVDGNKSLSTKGFDGLAAADKFRLLLNSCGIPKEIPAGFQQLLSFASSENWDDGPQAFAEVRNAFVHGNPAKRAKIKAMHTHALYETWCLGQWLLELSILKIIGYNSYYANRTKSGRSILHQEKVPWCP